ncbi:hypothetical protein LPKW2_14205 [Lactiplantibacillus pentosus]|nr:hypothetical protein LPKW2_14205 [Lactiplantibacillus pentosus]
MRKLRAMIRTFKRYGDMIKPFDIIIIVALIILSFTPLAIFSYQQKQPADRAALVAKKAKKGQAANDIYRRRFTRWYGPQARQYYAAETDDDLHVS